MAHSRAAIEWLAPLATLLLAAQASAQTVTVTIPSYSYGSQILVYGEPQTYIATLSVPSGSTLPEGDIDFNNDTMTLVSVPLSRATTSGNSESVSFTDTARATRLAAGIYNAYHAVYPGDSANGVTWTAADSNPGLSFQAFQVLPASVALSYIATPFTLANFTAALTLVAVNINVTNAVPEGPVYGVIYSLPDNTIVTNSSLDLRVADANTLYGNFPASFDPAQELTIGTYQAVFTYYPTPNFTQPTPLVVGFSVVNVTVPAPSPPPGAVPPPPPPPSNGFATQIVLEVFYQAGKEDWFKKDCSGSALIFTASVRGPSFGQVPDSGTITFQVLPSGVTIGSQPVQPDAQLGSATVTFVQSAPDHIGYGQYTIVATYSGSTDGLYLPSRAAAVLHLSEECGEHGDLLSKIGDVASTIVHSVKGDSDASHYSNSIYGYGNGYDGFGYGNRPYPDQQQPYYYYPSQPGGGYVTAGK